MKRIYINITSAPHINYFSSEQLPGFLIVNESAQPTQWFHNDVSKTSVNKFG